MLRPSSFAADSTLATSSSFSTIRSRILLAEFGVSRLASAEHDGDLHLVTIVEKLLDESSLGVEVTGSDLRAVLHLLDSHVEGLSTRLLGLLGLVELELPVVHDATDGRLRGGRDLYEIQVEASGQRQCITGCHHATLVSLVVDQTYSLHANSFIDAVVSRHCCDNSLLALRDAVVASPRQAGRKTPGNLAHIGGQVDVGLANLTC